MVRNFFINCERTLSIGGTDPKLDFVEYSNLAGTILVGLMFILSVIYLKLMTIDRKNKKILFVYLVLSILMITRHLSRIFMREYWWKNGGFIKLVCPTWFRGETCTFCDIGISYVMISGIITKWLVVFMFWILMSNISEVLVPINQQINKYVSYLILVLTFLGNGTELIMSIMFLDDVDGKAVYVNREKGGLLCGIGANRQEDYLLCAGDWIIPYDLSLMTIIVFIIGFKLHKIRITHNRDIINLLLRYIFILISIMIIYVVDLLSIYYVNTPGIWPVEYIAISLSLFMLLPIGNTFYRFFFYIPIKLGDILISRFTDLPPIINNKEEIIESDMLSEINTVPVEITEFNNNDLY